MCMQFVFGSICQNDKEILREFEAAHYQNETDVIILQFGHQI